MSLVDRINAAILTRVRSATPAHSSGACLEAFLTANRLFAIINDAYVGETMALLAESHDGTVSCIDEHDARWSELLLALDADGRTKASSTEWRLRLIGDPERNPVALI